MAEKTRCAWSGTDSLYVAYHDAEWGVPVHDDRTLFEFLVLEGAQAGLSLDHDPAQARGLPRGVRPFSAGQGRALRREKGRLAAARSGNRAQPDEDRIGDQERQGVSAVQQEFGSFDAYQWRFVDGRPLVNRFRSMKEVPARTDVSDAFSRDLKQRGFSFVGSTIIYAHMQAVGMVNDHVLDCFRYPQLTKGRGARPALRASRPRTRSERV